MNTINNKLERQLCNFSNRYMDNHYERDLMMVYTRGSVNQGLNTISSDLDLFVLSLPCKEDIVLGRFLPNHNGHIDDVEYQERDFRNLRTVFTSANVDSGQLLWSKQVSHKGLTHTQSWLDENGLYLLTLNTQNLMLSAIGNARKATTARLSLHLYNLLVSLEIHKFLMKEQTKEETLLKLKNTNLLTDKVSLMDIKLGDESALEEGRLLLSSLLVECNTKVDALMNSEEKTKRVEEFHYYLAQLDTAIALDTYDSLIEGTLKDELDTKMRIEEHGCPFISEHED